MAYIGDEGSEGRTNGEVIQPGRKLTRSPRLTEERLKRGVTKGLCRGCIEEPKQDAKSNEQIVCPE